MCFRLVGWPDGHPHQTKLEGYPFRYVEPKSPNPLLDQKRDGYASSFKRLYGKYKRQAADKGWEFTISPEDFYFFTSQPCILCAAPPSRRMPRAKNPYIYNGPRPSLPTRFRCKFVVSNLARILRVLDLVQKAETRTCDNLGPRH